MFEELKRPEELSILGLCIEVAPKNKPSLLLPPVQSM